MISFKYELEGAGWADAYLSDGTTTTQIPASYICDALRDLVDATQSVFTTTTTQCVWEEEPGEARWFFMRHADSLEVRVEWWNEVRTHPDRNEWHLVLDKVMFSGSDNLVNFATQMDHELVRLLEKWGVEGYERAWEYPFPTESHQRLRQAITNFAGVERNE